MQSLDRLFFEGAPDLVHLRRVARRVVQLLGFDPRDEVKMTAAVSELTRAASSSGGGVRIHFAVDRRAADSRFIVEVSGPGLAAPARQRGTVAAAGVTAAERLLNQFAEPVGANTLRFETPVPARTPELTGEQLETIRAELKRMDAIRADLSHEELTQQSRELAEALLDLEERKQELLTLNAELSDTNRGVMALYAELDERAGQLRRAGELKTRFFSEMSHEFRTPLSSILALSDMLLAESDGPLAPEQRRQVGLIRDGVAGLLDLVSDLLDLAKMEAGKTQVNVSAFAVGTLFGALRAMIRPLLGNSGVTLEFGGSAELPELLTDEAKITQILRNFLSNAVKFTECGAITASARLVNPGDLAGGLRAETESVLFAVADTGIGIAAEQQSAIFEEFRQVHNPLQRRSRGTGLGLPLCRRLAGLLGGRVWVESEVGHGSTFYLLVPRVHEAAIAEDLADPRPRLLIVDRLPQQREALRDAFRDSAFLAVATSPADITAASVAALQPAAAIVDAGGVAPAALEALRAAAVPLVSLLGADEARSEQLVTETYRAVLRATLKRILIIDDDETYRMILGRHIAPLCDRVRATARPQDGMVAARRGDVDCIVLDLIMPEMDGLTVLQRLRGDAATAHLPVVVCSSKSLTADEQALLHQLRAPFLSKGALGAREVARALLDARRLAGPLERLTESAA